MFLEEVERQFPSSNFELLQRAFTKKPTIDWETHESRLTQLMKPLSTCKMRHGTKVELSDLPIYQKPLWGE